MDSNIVLVYARIELLNCWILEFESTDSRMNFLRTRRTTHDNVGPNLSRRVLRMMFSSRLSFHIWSRTCLFPFPSRKPIWEGDTENRVQTRKWNFHFPRVSSGFVHPEDLPKFMTGTFVVNNIVEMLTQCLHAQCVKEYKISKNVLNPVCTINYGRCWPQHFFSLDSRPRFFVISPLLSYFTPFRDRANSNFPLTKRLIKLSSGEEGWQQKRMIELLNALARSEQLSRAIGRGSSSVCPAA